MPATSGKNVSVYLEHGEEPAGDLEFFSGLRQATEIEQHHEGQLSVDVAETPTELIIVAPMAGAWKDRVELHLQNDLLTIRGERENPIPADAEFHFAECYWGKFSRSVILPVDVRLEMAQAEFRNGLLVVRLPKIKTDQAIPITIVEE